MIGVLVRELFYPKNSRLSIGFGGRFEILAFLCEYFISPDIFLISFWNKDPYRFYGPTLRDSLALSLPLDDRPGRADTAPWCRLFRPFDSRRGTKKHLSQG